ncbi:hypothetical protein ACEZCY_35080 [Streptacidiphilus sp. N1-12]|uniref:NAD-dependent DNA ligase adenylation domain-containing protein n=2 Tax=Streptacidiphilus alkalitolerans TaxID=3342712 RepID=A0ABV6WQU8_9ACTN
MKPPTSLDGVALAARYRDGRLTQLVTQGDGTTGEDVSHAHAHAIGDAHGKAAPAGYCAGRVADPQLGGYSSAKVLRGVRRP